MSEKRTESSERKFMNAVSEASIRLRRIAEPRPVGDTVKEAINRSARRVSKFLRQAGFSPMSATRAEDLWRQEARRVDAEEMDAIRAADAAAERVIEEARNALAEHDARIARLEALLVQDEEFHRDQVAAHLAAHRGPDRPVDGG